MRLNRTAGDDDADRRDPGTDEHIEHRPSDAGVIDHKLRTAGQLRQEPADMGDDAGVRSAEREALKMPNLKDRRRQRRHWMNLAKSSTRASSIISEENTELSASINSPSNSWANSIGPSFSRIFSRNSAPMRGHSRPTILIRSTSTACSQFS